MSETREHLYPSASLKKCRCGIRFTARVAVSLPTGEQLLDNSELCLSCNRKAWSVLFGYAGKPAGSVVSIKRGRR